MAPASAPEGERGVYLEVQFDADAAHVSVVARIPRTTRSILRPPLLRPDTIAGYASPASEIGLMVLNARGAPVDSFGWPARSMAFFDRSSHQEGRDVEGRPQLSEARSRVLRVPTRPGGDFLFFYRSDYAHEDGDAANPRLVLNQRPLGLYHIGPQGVPPVALEQAPIPGLRMPAIVPLAHKVGVRAEAPQDRPDGRIVGSETLISTGRPEERFDIVILGDGFTDVELPTFDHRAGVLARGLIAMEPFASLAGRINIHLVRSVSAESGITDCPSSGSARRTMFGARGNFNGLFNGFIGVPDPERLYQAAERIAPRQELEVFLVIANCAIEGGSAFPDLRLAFVTMYADETKFVNIAAHEMAHVMIGAAEEYIGCAEADRTQTYPNQGTEAQRASGTLPWADLALPRELDGTGAFRAVHVLGDPFDANNEPIVDRAVTGMLGAFWGCQDIDPETADESCDPYQDARGKSFFRGMARCRMRKSRFDFCRVCADRMTTVVRESSS